jgi:tRNA splicing ligase
MPGFYWHLTIIKENFLGDDGRILNRKIPLAISALEVLHTYIQRDDGKVKRTRLLRVW